MVLRRTPTPRTALWFLHRCSASQGGGAMLDHARLVRHWSGPLKQEHDLTGASRVDILLT